MKFLILFLAAALHSVAAFGQTNSPQDNPSHIYQYTPGDGGILYTMTRGNRWAIINLGTSASGGDAVSQLFDMNTGEHFPVTYSGRSLPFTMASNDGNIIVGYLGAYAMSYDRANNIICTYPNRPLWKNGQLVDCTPDGRYAVGYYEGYLGSSDDADIPNDWFYRTLFVDTQTGDTIHTPNLPTRNRMGGKLQSIRFNSITPDGKYILGSVDWYLDGGFSFIYDVAAKRTLTNTSLLALYGGNVASRYPDVQSCSGGMLSPDGNAIGGTARVIRQTADGKTETVSAPCVYFIDRDSLAVYTDAEEGNVSICDMDNAGTFFGVTETGTPLRNFKILYKGKYWVTLNQICHQRYGYDFYQRTGYERTGTIMGVSGDGHRLISFHDPMGESYCFDFGMSVEEACAGLDLLSTYTATPEAASEFARFNTVAIQFERPVQILGTGRNVHLYDSSGKLVTDGISSSSGLTLKTGSLTTILANFRTRLLTPGEHYTLLIDSGTVATAVDKSVVNGTIRIPYFGREDGPVRLLSSTPSDHSTLQRIDNASSYVLLTFDCKVQLTNSPLAYIERISDGSRAATLNMVAGSEEQTRHQVLLYPSTTVNLFSGHDYRIVVEPGSVSDFTGDENSYNDSIVINLHGSFVRVVPTGEILFQDSWDDIAESLQTWLRYEGDHNTPLASMQAWEFDADNQPWNFSIRESNSNPDYCAASHSLYAPSGRSDDWMLTPQIYLPDQGKCMLEFDAQSYVDSRSDTLEVYVFEQEFTLSYLNDAWMEDIRRESRLVFKEVLSAGESQEGLAGEWTHYSIDLSPWNGKAVYVAFVNHNYNQSAIFVDNVVVHRDVPYLLALDFEDRIVGQSSQVVSGQLTVKKTDAVPSISLTLRDAEGREVSRIQWDNITSSVAGRAIPFTFAEPLPLIVGETNHYTIDISLGDTEDIFRGSITDLAFQPVRRVVLEEMTGIDCPNCPLGILTIEKLEKTFGDQFIPVSIHTFTGDPYAGTMGAYSSFLGLNAAPSARINRIPGIFYPMASTSTAYFDTYPADPLWYDVVASELARLSLADISLQAVRSTDGKTLDIHTDLRYAVNATDQQLSLLVVILENGLVNYQANNLGSLSYDILGEWGANGTRSDSYAYPVTHNDVARSIIGQSMSGTIGLFPSSLEAGTVYSANFTAAFPLSISSTENATAVAMLIDTQSGEIINAARTQIVDHDPSGIDPAVSESGIFDIYTPSGQLFRRNATENDMKMLPRGLYIIGKKKIFVR